NLPVGEQHEHLGASRPGHRQIRELLVFNDLAEHYLNPGAEARAVYQGKRHRRVGKDSGEQHIGIDIWLIESITIHESIMRRMRRSAKAAAHRPWPRLCRRATPETCPPAGSIVSPAGRIAAAPAA